MNYDWKDFCSASVDVCQLSQTLSGIHTDRLLVVLCTFKSSVWKYTTVH